MLCWALDERKREKGPSGEQHSTQGSPAEIYACHQSNRKAWALSTFPVPHAEGLTLLYPSKAASQLCLSTSIL